MNTDSPKVRVVAGPSSWIEGEAVRQLEKMAELPGMVRAVGMPDLHPGQGCPVGAVFVTDGRVYPHLIGTDIGCGMSLWTTSIQERRPERIEKKLKGLESGLENAETVLHDLGVECCGYEHSLGTIGRGNHFAELQVIDQVINKEKLDQIIPPESQENVLLLVHSGSRGYGEKILFDHTAEYQGKGLEVFSDAFDAYMDQHDHAMQWATINRRMIATRFFDCLGAYGSEIFDVPHNFLEGPRNSPRDSEIPALWMHRKGAIPSDRGPVVIPGSRGAHSYLVEPIWDRARQVEAGYSLSHGAGRKMSRKDATEKLKRGTREWSRVVSFDNLKRTKFGSLVICENKQLLMEENPEAYKPIDRVIQDLVDAGLIQVVALLKPIVTYKMRQSDEEKTEHDRLMGRNKPKYVKNRHG